MSFIRAPFRKFVTDQLELRERILTPLDRDSSWYSQYLTKSAFLRVAPLVNIKDKKILGGLDSVEFSKNFVLEGVPLNYNKSSAKVTNSKGKEYTKDTSTLTKMPQFPSQLSKGNSDSLLNNPLLRTSPDKDGFGIIPPPGVTSMKLKTKSFYGNLRECSFTIRCFSIQQFEIIEKLYTRPGHHVLLEWGWNQYMGQHKSGNYYTRPVGALVSDVTNKKFWGKSVSAGPIYREIDRYKVKYKGCYDGFLGIVKNFTSKIENDGGFSVTVQLIGRGDILDSVSLDRSGEVKTRYSDNKIAKSKAVGTALTTSADLYYSPINLPEDDKSQTNSDLASTIKTNLHNLMRYTIDTSLISSTITQPKRDTSTGWWRDELKFSATPQLKPFYCRSFVDAIQLSSTAGNFSGETTAGVVQNQINTGPYIRLGYLVKLLNSLSIPTDGKGQPMVTINNLSYTKNFNPNDTSKYDEIYPNCYSRFSFDSVRNESDSKTALKTLINLWKNDYDSDFKTEITKEVNDFLKDKENTPTGGENTILETDKSAFSTNAPTNKNGYEGIVLDIFETYMDKPGSCIPSKVLFPHQFVVKERTHVDQPSGWAPVYKTVQNLVLKTPGVGGLTAEDNSSLTVSLTDVFEWNNLKGHTNASPIAPDAIQSEDFASSLAAHALLDSTLYLSSQNKVIDKFHSNLEKKIKDEAAGRKLEKFIDKLSDHSNHLFDKTRIIDNIYLNTFWLEGWLKEKSLSQKGATLDDFLGLICNQINKASGGSTDLKVATNPVFSDVISIVDFNINSDALSEINSENTFVFNKTGRNSIFKSINITGKIPSAQASSIAIAAQGPKDEGNILSVTYKAFVEDIEDRIAAQGNSSYSTSEEELLAINTKKVEKFKNKFWAFINACLAQVDLYNWMEKKYFHVDVEGFSDREETAMESARILTNSAIYLTSNVPKKNSSGVLKIESITPSLPMSSVIPLKVNITLEGVSGILASNIFKIARGVLPNKYSQKRISYMITQESQNLKGLMWETSIEASLVLDDTDKRGAVVSKSQPVIKKEKVEETIVEEEVKAIVVDPVIAEEKFEEPLGSTPATGNFIEAGSNMLDYDSTDFQYVGNSYTVGGVDVAFTGAVTDDEKSLQSKSIKAANAYVLGWVESNVKNKNSTYTLPVDIRKTLGGEIPPSSGGFRRNAFKTTKPKYIVLHTTAGWESYVRGAGEDNRAELGVKAKAKPQISMIENSLPGKFRWYGKGATAHYYVDGTGEIWQNVLEKDAAWHAGSSDSGTEELRIKGLNKALRRSNEFKHGWTEAQVKELMKYGHAATTSNSLGIEMCGDMGGYWGGPSTNPTSGRIRKNNPVGKGGAYPENGLSYLQPGGGVAKMYNETMLNTVAALVANMCKKYDIKADKEHIVGHDMRTPLNRSGPGTWQGAFNWDDFFDRVNTAMVTATGITPDNGSSTSTTSTTSTSSTTTTTTTAPTPTPVSSVSDTRTNIENNFLTSKEGKFIISKAPTGQPLQKAIKWTLIQGEEYQGFWPNNTSFEHSKAKTLGISESSGYYKKGLPLIPDTDALNETDDRNGFYHYIQQNKREADGSLKIVGGYFYKGTIKSAPYLQFLGRV